MAAPSDTGWKNLLAEGRLPRFALICLGVWLNAADALVTATIMPSVGADLGGYAYFSWAVAGFLAGAIVAGASAGRVAEVVGLRMATVIGGLAFAVGCVLSAVAPDIGVFLAGRVLQGIGSGWISGFSMVAVALLFPARHLARVFASISGVWGVATVLGPLVGGAFAEAGDWRGVFWLFAVQALLFAAATPWLLKGTDPPAEGAGIPWKQLGVLGVGAGAIALSDVNGSPWISAGLLVAGLATLAWVLGIDDRARVRLMPRGSGDLRGPVGAAYAAMFALMAASMGLTVYGPAILQTLAGLSPLWAGYAVGAEALAWTVAALSVAHASARAETGWIRGGAACIFVGVAVLAATMREASVVWVVLGAGVMGLGFGLQTSLLNQRVMRTLDDEDRAVGASALISVRQTGGAVGAAIAGATANLVGFRAGLTEATAQAAAVWVFVTALPLAVAGVWATWQATRPFPDQADSA